jgi:hypothetical protein
MEGCVASQRGLLQPHRWTLAIMASDFDSAKERTGHQAGCTAVDVPPRESACQISAVGVAAAHGAANMDLASPRSVQAGKPPCGCRSAGVPVW